MHDDASSIKINIMYWQRIKHLFSLHSQHPLMHSHASNPLALQISAHRFRVFFSTRNIENKSSVSFFDLDMETLSVIDIALEPIATFMPNTFYDHGISIGSIYEKGDGKKFMTFMGWTMDHLRDHWMGYLGEMLLEDEKYLTIQPMPLISPKDLFDPISISYADIVRFGGLYYAFYGSTITWDAGNQEMIHTIQLAISKDGDVWEKKGIVLPFEKNKIQAFSRPTIIRIGEEWHMWFSYRSGNRDQYKIGHAKTNDLYVWDLALEEASLYPDLSIAWESEMVEYPYVFKYKENIYMLYNGNSYGKTGIGICQLKGLIK
jgi:hypothetical protein